MNLYQKSKLLFNIAKYEITKNRYDIDYLPPGIDSTKFITARQAVSRIKDSSTVISAGMASHSRCAVFFWAVRDVFKETGSPSNLSWITVSAQGGRGKRAGTIEEIAVPGLLKQYISGHVETATAILKLGTEKKVEIHTLPQGEITELLVAQAEGKNTVESQTGIGTFFDPDLGGSTAVTPNTDKSYVVKKDGKMVYTIPKIEVALFMAPYADVEGNIYFKNASSISESYEAVMAANKNGGKAFVTVCDIIEKNEADISIPGEYITGVVVNPWNEQAGGVRQRQYWPFFTAGADVNPEVALQIVDIINKFGRLSPKRTPVENSIAREVASIVSKETKKSALINLGIGLPEEVGKIMYHAGIHNNYIFSSEAGAYGGIPTPGLYFGGAINPIRLESSAWMFNHYKEHLDTTVLGLLQADSEGNVNVSRRGSNVADYIGPGGFMNIVNSAKTIIFTGSFMAKAEFALKKGQLTIKKKGIPKFVDQLNEITFNAKEALKQGKKVYYVTSVGVFKLIEKGIELVEVMPGIDI
ncbi:hypothetical protein KKA14_16525, partial [bacterium]|nr:hypothetical protein [bacterium]